MSKYGYIFEQAEQELDFDQLVVEVNEENKDVVIPMLLKMIEAEVQKKKVREICERLKFDLVAAELGVDLNNQNKTIN